MAKKMLPDEGTLAAVRESVEAILTDLESGRCEIVAYNLETHFSLHMPPDLPGDSAPDGRRTLTITWYDPEVDKISEQLRELGGNLLAHWPHLVEGDEESGSF